MTPTKITLLAPIDHPTVAISFAEGAPVTLHCKSAVHNGRTVVTLPKYTAQYCQRQISSADVLTAFGRDGSYVLYDTSRAAYSSTQRPNDTFARKNLAPLQYRLYNDIVTEASKRGALFDSMTQVEYLVYNTLLDIAEGASTIRRLHGETIVGYVDRDGCHDETSFDAEDGRDLVTLLLSQWGELGVAHVTYIDGREGTRDGTEI